MRFRALQIRRRLLSRRLPSLRFSALLAASPPSLNCAPVLQGNFCIHALPRIVNPAQVALPSFALSPFFCFVSRSPSSLNYAPVLQGNFCTYALPRIVNPAQVSLPPAASSPFYYGAIRILLSAASSPSIQLSSIIIKRILRVCRIPARPFQQTSINSQLYPLTAHHCSLLLPSASQSS